MGKNESSSIQQIVYEELRKSILSLRLIPGTTMSTQEMAERLNVSRTPVREAFLRLQAEGLVISLPQRGTVVSRINLERVNQECFIREGLEHAVIRPFVAHCEPEVIAQLRELNERQRECYRKKEWERVFEYDSLFHQQLFETARKPMGWEIIITNNGHYDRARMLAIQGEDISGDIYREHSELTDQLEQGNIKQAQSLVYQHVYGGGKINPAFRILEKFPDYVSESGEDAEIRIGRL